jgi:putative oxidoreductase
LLLRLATGIAVICLGIGGLLRMIGEPITIAGDLIAAAGGIFLLAGLWTPVTGALTSIHELWIAFSLYSSPGDGRWIHTLLAALTAAVAMLGPGAWSIDARLFGRRRFDIGDRTRSRKRSH